MQIAFRAILRLVGGAHGRGYRAIILLWKVLLCTVFLPPKAEQEKPQEEEEGYGEGGASKGGEGAIPCLGVFQNVSARVHWIKENAAPASATKAVESIDAIFAKAKRPSKESEGRTQRAWCRCGASFVVE